MGKTLPLSWVQGLRRISGPGFAWVGLQGSWGCWLQGRDCAVLAGVGLLGQTLFPTSDFSPLSPKRVIDEHFSKASPHQVVPSAFHAYKSGNEWSPEVPPAQGHSSSSTLGLPSCLVRVFLGCGFGTLVLISLYLGQKGFLQMFPCNSSAFECPEPLPIPSQAAASLTDLHL